MQFTSIFLFFFSFPPKGVLKRRDQIQGELDSKVDALANKRTEKDLVSVFRRLDSSRPCCSCRRGAEGRCPLRPGLGLGAVPTLAALVPGKGHHWVRSKKQHWVAGLLVMVGNHWPLSTQTGPQLIFSFYIPHLELKESCCSALVAAASVM